MRRGNTWLALVSACLLPLGCGDDDDDSQMNSDPDAGAHRDAESSSDSGTISDSGTNQDSGSDGGRLVDQKAPNGANGLAFDAEGMIWLADLFGNQILRFDPKSGKILDRVVQEAAGPDDIAIDEEGRVFWTGWGNGQVGRFDPKTRENVIIAELPIGANSLAFSEDGRLFVGLVLRNNGLYEVDPEGMTDARLITDDLGSLNAFDFGPDGFLWGPLEDAIAKIDIDTGEVVETVGEGAYASVRYSEEDDALYALTGGEDRASPALNKIDLDGYEMSLIAEPNLAGIDNFVIGPDGEFFVTGFGVPEFVVIDPDGSDQTLTKIGEPRE